MLVTSGDVGAFGTVSFISLVACMYHGPISQLGYHETVAFLGLAVFVQLFSVNGALVLQSQLLRPIKNKGNR